MKTKFLTSLMVLCAIVAVALVPLPASAYDFMVDGICYKKNSDGKTVAVTHEFVDEAGSGYSNVVGHVDIPESVTYNGVNYIVTNIGDYAFRCSEELTSVTIPNTITEIGDYAFEECVNLLSVELPNSVTSIGKNCFRGCEKLESVKLSDALQILAANSFENTGLKSVYIPASVTTIDPHAFQFSSQLESIAVDPENPIYDSRDDCNAIVETATNRLIAGCKYTIIPTSVSCIGQLAFRGHSQLKNLIIPLNVTSIERYSIADNENLENICVFWSTPITIDATALAYMYPNKTPLQSVILHVPKGCLSAYQKAENWKLFSTIIDDIEYVLPDDYYVVFDDDEQLQVPGGIKPIDIIPQDIKWLMSDENVASIENGGTLVPLNVGISEFTVKDNRGFGLEGYSKIAIISREQREAEVNNLLLNGDNTVLGVVNEDSILPVTLLNTGDVNAFSFTFSLPERMELSGEPTEVVERTGRTASFDIKTIINNDGTITVSGSATDGPMTAGDGAIANIKLKTSWQNIYTIPLTDMAITSSTGEVKVMPDSVTKLVIQGVRGDMNGDGRVDASDALYIYHLSLGLTE